MPITDDHGGYVAGGYRDGSLSDGWTDVLRCGPGTFVRFVPRCACGWVGHARPATPAGAAGWDARIDAVHRFGMDLGRGRR